MSSPLRLRGIDKRFADTLACVGVELELPGDGHVCIMGASGSGKTTLLRIVAGLERADAGEIWIGDRRVDGLAPERRPTHTAFQSPALFPHLSVLANVTFVDRLRPRPTGPPAIAANRLLELLGLAPEQFADRGVEALSGGERQRVALARALYRAPAWVLLDEPLSALDRPLRASLRRALVAARREVGCALLHVTHEAEDALSLADLVVVMDRGRVLAVDRPERLYQRPPDLVTARLFGELSPSPDPTRPGWLRPERLTIVPAERGRVPAILRGRSFAGAAWDHELSVGSEVAAIVVRRPEPWQGPETCGLTWDDDDLMCWTEPDPPLHQG
jgi:ABC-type Fe3+/spermidine/putrescine transport system ATPase subunit